MNHMNSKVLIGLAGAALLALIGAMFLAWQREPADEAALTSGYALPGLWDRLNDVTGIVMTVAENKTAVTLAHKDNGWTVREKGGYPADSVKVRELLLHLADAELVDAKTANEQRHPELGVEDIKTKDAKGVQVSLEGLDRATSLIIGNISGKSDGTFVRKPEDKQSWLAKGAITVPRDPLDWLDKSLTDIRSERISGVALTRPGSKMLELFKSQSSDADYQIADLPKGLKINSAAEVNALASTLDSLNFTDVLPRQTANRPNDNSVLKGVYRTFDGLQIDVLAWQEQGRHYAQLNAEFDRKRAEAHIKAEHDAAKSASVSKQESAGKGADKTEKADAEKPKSAEPDPQQRLQQLETEADGLNKRLADWVFEIPSAKYGNINKSLADLTASSKRQDKPKK